MKNPFDVVSAELMDLSQVGREFVREHTEFAKLAAFSHTVVFGSRGSGKSMHFRFLEPLAQASRPDLPHNGDTHEFLHSEGAFIGIYVNCRDGILNREEFKWVSSLANIDSDFLHLLMDRYLAAVIGVKLSSTVAVQIPSVGNVMVRGEDLPAGLRLEPSEISVGVFLETLKKSCHLWMEAIRELVESHFLALPETPPRETFPRDALRLTVDLPQILEVLRKAMGVEIPFFLLFDEANELSRELQECVNILVAQRTQNLYCIKIASQLHGYSTALPRRGAVDQTHDYTSIDLDALYTSHQEAYYLRLKRIVDQRLTRCGVSASPDAYFPPNPTDVEMMGKARKLAEERYEDLRAEERPVDRANFIKKYAPAILFQELRSPKAGKSYAGFDNLVHLSSGIVRSFLECGSKMYTRYMEEHGEEPSSAIPISIQNAVIEEYSNEFIQSQIIDRLSTLSATSVERLRLTQLHNLLLGLGKLFRRRLMDVNSREPRIISISIRGGASEDVQAVLILAEQEAFLHRKWYRSKRGDANLPCYVLNRRLCPFFNLDLTGFQGRIEVTSEELETALVDPDEFTNRMMDRGKSAEAPEEQLSLFEW